MKKLLIIIVFTVLGAVALNLLVSFFSQVRWQRLDYFPHPVEKLLAVKPFGWEISIETEVGDIYKIVYPCLENQDCWELSSGFPVLEVEWYFDNEINQFVSYYVRYGECERYNNLVGVFRGEIHTCITSVAMAESFYVVALVLTEENELWIWEKPWVSPYDQMRDFASMLCIGALLGLLAGMFIAFNKG